MAIPAHAATEKYRHDWVIKARARPHTPVVMGAVKPASEEEHKQRLLLLFASWTLNRDHATLNETAWQSNLESCPEVRYLTFACQSQYAFLARNGGLGADKVSSFQAVPTHDPPPHAYLCHFQSAFCPTLPTPPMPGASKWGKFSFQKHSFSYCCKAYAPVEPGAQAWELHVAATLQSP